MFARSVVVVLLLGAVAAQSSNSSIDPGSVDPTLRSQWCQGQQNTCGTLCSGDIATNACDPDTLKFACTCAANNSAPGLQYYTETIATFVCERVFTDCIKNNAGDAAAQALCNSNEKKNCGHLNPNNFTESAATTSSSSSAKASATQTSASSGAAGAATTTSSSKAAGATVAAMRNLGTGAFAVGAAAALGYML